MQTYELLLLAGLLFIGTVTSYEDIKEGRIRNKWVAAGLLYSFCATFFYAASIYSTQNILPLGMIFGYALNIALVLAIGIALWMLDFWNAADAKLAAVLASLVPISYSFGIPFAPFIIVLLNTFLMSFAVLFMILLLKTSLKEKAEVFGGVKPKAVAESAIFVFGFSWAAKNILKLAGFEQGIPATLAIVLIFLLALSHFSVEHLPISIAFSVLHIAFGFASFTIPYMASLALLLLLFIITQKFVIGLSELKFRQETIPFAPILFTVTLVTIMMWEVALLKF